ncbi:hypothetical protein GLOTRDRAFT_137826 [Gloeophyllum trabeum ATCC 11539]|uniref:J domain-containing protein n=1 Tax=Gloeophyllum trabeum (strain ATCC 11539 / FP-39264 / Madison 617) TaxID=670483 RepID=S7QDT3_GLOTA|nr:uncharacterized protein GLOTRDRAFT_137826 [Gloeophyllum trabeum ATCC 11539]EPQ57517.1 hypothetical protein GLOTRDRAFT_137826 [Gloeophyllum trabeum ATCC 11539]
MARLASSARSARCWRGTLATVRFSSSSSNPLPFPNHPNPTAHQIFHLPASASQADIKARYYELVRLYHPDSPISRTVSPESAQARFHAISAAYKVLRGKTVDPSSSDINVRKDYHDLSTAIWKEKQRRRAELKVGVNDQWKDRLLLGSVILAVAAFVAQTFTSRRQALRGAVESTRANTDRSEFAAGQRAGGGASEVDAGRLAAPDLEPIPADSHS